MSKLKGREQTLAWITANTPGRRFAVVEGAPLSGRSAIWGAVVERARALDHTVLACRASPADPGRPWSTVQRLIAG